MNITAPKLALVYHLPMTEEYSYVERLNPRAEHPDPVLAAIVSTDDLEVAFEKTNTIDRPWQANPEVIETGFSNRSTTVGDYVQIGINIYRCDPAGWTHVAPTKWQLIKSFFIGVTT